jgi:dTDP-4-dehydrorhamnose reductase
MAINKKYEVYSAFNRHVSLYGKTIQFDVSDGNAVKKAFRKIKPEVVVHAAALTNVDKCEVDKKLAWKINVEGTENIAKLCKEHDVFLIYISTDYVFDGERGMYKENDDPAPINYYGFTKLKGEEKVKHIVDEYCIARTSVIYGLIPATGKINFTLWLLEKLKEKEKVKIVTDQWNSPTLNTNLADMLLEIIERKKTGIYHLAGATRINRYRFAELIAKTFKLDSKLITPTSSTEFSWIAKRPQDSSLSVKKAYCILKNKPSKVNEALKKMRIEFLQTR